MHVSKGRAIQHELEKRSLSLAPTTPQHRLISARDHICFFFYNYYQQTLLSHTRLMSAVPDCNMADSIPQWRDYAWYCTPGGFTLVAIAVLSMAFILQRLIFPKFGPREPPVLSSRIPVIGHLISLMREKTSFYRRLYRDNSLPICTLPMLNGKLISSAMRSKDISFDPFALEFTVNAVSYFVPKLQEVVT